MSSKFFASGLHLWKLVIYAVALILCMGTIFHSTRNVLTVSDRFSSVTVSQLNHRNNVETKEDINRTLETLLCARVQLAPEHSLPSIALHSYPGSGNTWVRYLVESATGIYTGSIYRDYSLIDGGFKGNSRNPGCGCTSVVKMHGIPKNIHRIPWQRGIHLMRNPYDAMVSDMNRRSSKNHTGHANENKFQGKAWNAYVQKQSMQWSKTFDDAVAFFDHILVVHYEDLQSDLATHLRCVLNFITTDTNSEILDASEDRFQCTLDHPKGNFKREKANLTFDPFTIELRDVVDENTRYVINKLRRTGHPLPPYAKDYPP